MHVANHFTIPRYWELMNTIYLVSCFSHQSQKKKCHRCCNHIKDLHIAALCHESKWLGTSGLKYINDWETCLFLQKIIHLYMFTCMRLSNWVCTSADRINNSIPQQKLLFTFHLNSLVDPHSFRIEWLMYTPHCQLSVVWWVLENALTYKPGGISQRGSM